MMNQENYFKFSCIIKDKLEKGELVFPKGTEFEYEPIEVYRGIERLEGDNTRPNRMDFRSYAELGKKKTRGKIVDTSDSHYYGVSFFRKKEIVENMLSFPNPKKKMMQGNVYCEGGPEETNEKTEHVCWWLYEDAAFDGFLIV